MFCRKCGSELPEGAAFCGNCGAPVSSADGQPQVSATSSPASPTPATSAPPTPPLTPTMASYPTPVTPVVVTAAPKKRKHAPILIVGICVLAVACVAICLIIMKPFGNKTASVTTSGSSVSINGTTVQAFYRPTIATTTTDSSSGISAAPALAGYLTSDGTSSSGSASSGTTGSGNVSVKNAYGTLPELKPTSGLGNVVNLNDFRLNSAQTSLLEQNMFAVDPSYGSCEFFDVYESNRYDMNASFVTTDSIMHTYHLYFSYLQKNAEKQYLSADLLTLSKSMLQMSVDQLNTLSGSEWEDAALRNVTFFSVACRLLDPSTEIPSSVESTVNDELAKIQDASQMTTCAITDDLEDYSQYKPRGYYEGDDQLERYFRAMMWYGRINFTQKSEDLDRSALLVTLALDGGTGGTADANWESIYTVTSFFAGASDDMSYYEYYPLFVYSYGDGATVADLAGNTKSWDTYHGLTATMPAPKISSVIVGDEAESTADDTKGFRFMGQRFSIDESVFQQLIYDNVGTKDDPRLLPTALDLPAALGSNNALSILDGAGETSYSNYSEQMEAIRTQLANSDDSIWSASLYSQWLYTLNPLLVSKGEGYPTFMQSSAWDQKNLQSYLGSYTELKHDTVLYSKQALAEMGGGVQQKDDRGYVEPEPDLYARLANLTQTTSDGLARYGMISSDDANNLSILKQLVVSLQTISEKELAGQSLSTEEYDLIRTYGGQLEHFWETVNTGASKAANRSAEYPAAVVVDVATDATDGTVLELATGKVSKMYVLVPIDGELHLCEGAVFSYYEFAQPQSDRLTDSTWRTMLGITGSSTQSSLLPSQPSWVKAFQTS